MTNSMPVSAEDKAAEARLNSAFRNAIAQKKSENDILLMIAQINGFKGARRVYQELMVTNGLSSSKEDRDKAVEAAANTDLSTEEGLNSAIKAICSTVKGVDEKGARVSLRAYAKKNELAIYTAPVGRGGGAYGFASYFYAAVVKNPTMSEADADAIINGDGDNADTSENVKRRRKHYQAIRKLANDIASKYAKVAA